MHSPLVRRSRCRRAVRVARPLRLPWRALAHEWSCSSDPSTQPCAMGKCSPRVRDCRCAGWASGRRFCGRGMRPRLRLFRCGVRTRRTRRHFICNPYGHGWHVDRRRMDEGLAVAAEEAGACVRRGARVLSCQPVRAAPWSVDFTRRRRRRRLQADFVVDATGRPSTLARAQGVSARIARPTRRNRGAFFGRSPARDSRPTDARRSCRERLVVLRRGFQTPAWWPRT